VGASNKGAVGKTSYVPALCVNISKTIRDTTIVTSNDQQEVAYALWIGTKVDDLG